MTFSISFWHFADLNRGFPAVSGKAGSGKAENFETLVSWTHYRRVSSVLPGAQDRWRKLIHTARWQVKQCCILQHFQRKQWMCPLLEYISVSRHLGIVSSDPRYMQHGSLAEISPDTRSSVSESSGWHDARRISTLRRHAFFFNKIKRMYPESNRRKILSITKNHLNSKFLSFWYETSDISSRKNVHSTVQFLSDQTRKRSGRAGGKVQKWSFFLIDLCLYLSPFPDNPIIFEVIQ